MSERPIFYLRELYSIQTVRDTYRGVEELLIVKGEMYHEKVISSNVK